MRKISFIVTDSGAITAVANGKSYTISPDHTNYAKLKEAVINDDVSTLTKLNNLPKAIKAYSSNKVDVLDGVVYFNGEALRNQLTEKILRLMADGFPIDPLVKFLENLMLNPSKRSVDQLYNFLERHGLPITDDGYFLAYKQVRNNYNDWHSNKINYNIGKTVEVTRNTVDDNPTRHCSYGLHVGALSYVNNFHNGEGKMIIVKVNPADCVSVPEDHDCTKLRACKLEVIGEYTSELTHTLYTNTGKPANADDYEDDSYWDDEDDSWLSEDYEFEDEDDEDEDDDYNEYNRDQ